jgi:hypothetical protein
MKQTFEIHSSEGRIEVDSTTGKVIKAVIDGDGYSYLSDIDRFDLQEWRDYYKDKEKDDCSEIDGIDILDFDFWYKDGILTKSVYRAIDHLINHKI